MGSKGEVFIKSDVKDDWGFVEGKKGVIYGDLRIEKRRDDWSSLSQSLRLNGK